MNWIKSNPFVSGLAGITVLLCGVLFFLASKWGTRYEDAKVGFDDSYQTVSSLERLPLYPDDDLRDGKRKAIADYRQGIDDLRGLFEPYRQEKTENITPQAFTDRLKAAHQEVSAAFAKSETELPENFFLGFEGYRNQLAQSDATGTLLYQMEGIQQSLMALAEARPSALLKVHRVAVEEENGGTFQPGPDAVARLFPFEITFRGSESSVREFLNSLGAKDSRYFIVRSLKIQNQRDTPPRVADAKFETQPAERAVVAPANPFADPFGAFAEEPVVEEPGPGEPVPGEPAPGEPAPGEPAAGEAPPEPAPTEVVDSSRILAQVLGSEDLIVFVRIDLAMFLPAKELSKP
jgi:hypothetical protein